MTRERLIRVALLGALGLILTNFAYLAWTGWHAAWWDFYYTRAEKAMGTPGGLVTAERDYRRALDHAELMVPSDGRLARTWHDLGMVYWGQLRHDQAARAFERALHGFRQYDGPESYFVGVVTARQGEIALQRGDVATAEARLRQAWSILRRCVGSRDSMAIRARASLGLSLFYLGRSSEALAELEEVAPLVAGNPRVGDLVYQNQVANALQTLRQVR